MGFRERSLLHNPEQADNYFVKWYCKESKMKHLAEKFISQVEEMSPALHNSAPLIQSSGWNTKKYFSKYYNDKTLFPLIILIKRDKGLMYFPISKAKALSKEVFKKYWQSTGTLT